MAWKKKRKTKEHSSIFSAGILKPFYICLYKAIICRYLFCNASFNFCLFCLAMNLRQQIFLFPPNSAAGCCLGCVSMHGFSFL